jgi:hypothetical protein
MDVNCEVKEPYEYRDAYVVSIPLKLIHDKAPQGFIVDVYTNSDVSETESTGKNFILAGDSLYFERNGFPIPASEMRSSVLAPADSFHVLAVGSQISATRMASYSSYGIMAYPEEEYPPDQASRPKPDVVTYGELTLADGSDFGGTSAAAPLMGGVVTLMRQLGPDVNAEFLRLVLMNEMISLPDTTGDIAPFGLGRLDKLTTPEEVQGWLAGGREEPVVVENPTGDLLQISVPQAFIRSGPSTNCNRRALAVETREFEILGWYDSDTVYSYEGTPQLGDDLYDVWYLIGLPGEEQGWIYSGIVRVLSEYDLNAIPETIPQDDCYLISEAPPIDFSNTPSDQCPDIDRDGVCNDGVQDRCPDLPGTPQNNGCPGDEPTPEPSETPDPREEPTCADSDGDGVCDSDDDCRNRGDEGYGLRDDGCPLCADSDGDGVCDYNDACPYQGDLGFGLQDDGCPNPDPGPSPITTPFTATDDDRDGDGVPNDNDQCPDQGSIGFGIFDDGCPRQQDEQIECSRNVDQDCDGVLNENDNCRNDPGPTWNNGCPAPPPGITPVTNDPPAIMYVGNEGRDWSIRVAPNTDATITVTFCNNTTTTREIRGTGTFQPFSTNPASRVTVASPSGEATASSNACSN